MLECEAVGTVWDLESAIADFKASLHDVKAVRLCRNSFPSLCLNFLLYKIEMEIVLISRIVAISK